MKFNKGKCKVLPMGRNNPRYQYTRRADHLESSFVEKDLRVMVNKWNTSQLVDLNIIS